MMVVLLTTVVIATPVCANENNVTDAEIALEIPDLLSVQRTIITQDLLDKMARQISNNDQLDLLEKEQRLSYISIIHEKYPNLTSDDTEGIVELLSTIISESEPVPTVTPYWGGVKPDEGPPYSYGMHNAMARHAASTMGITNTAYLDLIEACASEPDTWFGQLGTVVHYNPTAQLYAEAHANEAISHLSAQSHVEGYKDLSYALHFMSDLSNTFHANTLVQDYGAHYLYEVYVANNWENGENYRNAMTSASGYYAITDVSEAGSNLASLAGSYANAIYLTLISEPNTWTNDPDVIAYTKECIKLGIRYDKGLVEYVIG